MITTKYGNKYSEQEWNEMMAEWDNDIAEANNYTEGMYAIIRAAAKMLEEIAGDKAYQVASRLWENGTEGIQFSSQEKQNAVEAIAAWMMQEEKKIR